MWAQTLECRWVSACVLFDTKSIYDRTVGPAAAQPRNYRFEVYYTCAASLPPICSHELAIFWVGEVGSHTRLNPIHQEKGRSIPQDSWLFQLPLSLVYNPTNVSTGHMHRKFRQRDNCANYQSALETTVPYMHAGYNQCQK